MSAPVIQFGFVECDPVLCVRRQLSWPDKVVVCAAAMRIGRQEPTVKYEKLLK